MYRDENHPFPKALDSWGAKNEGVDGDDDDGGDDDDDDDGNGDGTGAVQPAVAAAPKSSRNRRRTRTHRRGQMMLVVLHEVCYVQGDLKDVKDKPKNEIHPDLDAGANYLSTMSAVWNRLTSVEKEVFEQQAKEDKERYEKEMKEYLEKNSPAAAAGPSTFP